MESKGEITLRMERLRLRAIKKNKKAGRMLKKMEKELAKRKADLPRVLAWQRKASRRVEQGLRHIKKREEERAKLKKVKLTNPSKESGQFCVRQSFRMLCSKIRCKQLCSQSPS